MQPTQDEASPGTAPRAQGCKEPQAPTCMPRAKSIIAGLSGASCHCSSIQAYQESPSCPEGGTVPRLVMLICQLWPFPITESCDFLSHHC